MGLTSLMKLYFWPLMKIFQYIWRIWFILLFLITMVAFIPWLILLTVHRSVFPAFYSIGRIWAWILCIGLGLIPKVENRNKGKLPYPHIVCGNHSSFLDVFLCYALFKRTLVFIGKKELAKIPLFGLLYKQVAILVDRSNLESKRQVLVLGEQRIEQGQGLVIFPEGGIPKVKTDLGSFKKGAFNIAAATGVPIIPVTFVDNKRKFPAYGMAGSPGRVRVIIHEAQYPNGNTEEDKNELKERVFKLIKSEIISDGSN